MSTNYTGQNAKIEKLFNHRKTVRNCRRILGLDKLTDRVSAVMEFIASRDGTRIQDIALEEYFADQSLSSIKRHVEILKNNKLVTVSVRNDKRARYLVMV